MRLEASAPTFVDAFLPPNAGRNDRLDRIDRLIDWPKVAAILDGVHAAPEGRPAYRPITMVKIIVLQQWHDASDVGMEEALQDLGGRIADSGGAELANRAGSRVMQRSPTRGEDAANAAGGDTADGRAAPPRSPGSRHSRVAGNPTGDRHSRVGGNLAPLPRRR